MWKGAFKKARFIFVRTAGIGTVSKQERGGGGKKLIQGRAKRMAKGSLAASYVDKL